MTAARAQTREFVKYSLRKNGYMLARYTFFCLRTCCSEGSDLIIRLLRLTVYVPDKVKSGAHTHARV
jgi:hypothetical protein